MLRLDLVRHAEPENATDRNVFQRVVQDDVLHCGTTGCRGGLFDPFVLRGHAPRAEDYGG